MRLRNKKTGETITLKDEGELALLKLIEDSLPNGLNVWEEVKEPLIKDEKVRKAVRAWAEVNSIKEVQYCERANRSLCILTDMGDKDFSIEFVGWIPTLKDGEVHTIAELCGEEEE